MSRAAFGQVYREPSASLDVPGIAYRLTNTYTYDGDGTAVVVPFDTIVWDTDAYTNSAGGVLIPSNRDGRYLMHGQLATTSGETGMANLGTAYIQQTRAAAVWDQWSAQPALEATPGGYSIILNFAGAPVVAEVDDLFEIYYATDGTFEAYVLEYWSWFVMEYRGPPPA